MEEELENSRRLLVLLDSGVAFMATTDQGETPLMHGENLRESLRKRMDLMEAHRDDEPFIDPDYMERQAGMPVLFPNPARGSGGPFGVVTQKSTV